MKKIVLSVFLFIIYGLAHSQVEINCKARYSSTVYVSESINVGSYSGTIIGSGNIYAPSSGRYVTEESNIYSINVIFYSGQAINDYTKKNLFNNNSIIAFVKWSNGGYNYIEIKNLTTNSYNLNENDITTDSYGNRINSLNGYDYEKRYWTFNF